MLFKYTSLYCAEEQTSSQILRMKLNVTSYDCWQLSISIRLILVSAERREKKKQMQHLSLADICFI